ncbi:MAG: glucosaminidase domain-containing protein [Tangfeifania sp.]
MRYTLPFILLMITAQLAFSQFTRESYIQKYQLLAIEEMGRSGIPASIKMAQAVLESGNGNSELSRKSNNHFGIKCKRNWTGGKVYYDDDEKDECFRKYKSVQDSYIDHSNFLMSNPRYAFLFQLAPDDYIGWAKGLKQAGYATAHHYDKSLIKIIEDNKLYRLDYKEAFSPLEAYREKQKLNEGMSDKMSINPFKSHKIVKINGLDAVVARQGDTYEIIARELDMKPWELYKFNDRKKGYKPHPREVVYVERKNRRAPKSHSAHVAEPGETMHFISQMYGIRLKPLIRRNRMEPGGQPQPGEVINLRKRKKN